MLVIADNHASTTQRFSLNLCRVVKIELDN